MIERLVSFMPVRKANSAYFYYRRNQWRWSRAFRDGREARIDRPVYLIGTQGGGLTLLSRILHRHRDVIGVTGDHRYWAGEDETQNALEPVLPEDFGWRKIDLPGYPSRNHGWVYGNDDFLAHYRRTAADADAAAAARYRRVLKGVIRQQGRGRAARFVDKSQSLTLRVGFLHASLKDCDPRFVLITRNPYALVWSQATRNGVVSKLEVPIEQKVRLCAQHWSNSMIAALQDARSDPSIRLQRWSFEALLADPANTLADICAFADLPRDDAILPGPMDTIPWGSMHDAFNRRKWYPLRTGVNDRYLASIPDWAVSMVSDICGDLAVELGYERGLPALGTP